MRDFLNSLKLVIYPVRTPLTSVGGNYSNKLEGVNAPIRRSGSARSNGVKISGLSSSIIVTALAKREEELYIEGVTKPVPLSSLPPETSFFFQRVRNESHRFAKKYHHQRRKIKYREK